MSEESLFQSPWNFLGLPENLATADRARGWVLPVPYEATTSYGAGTREGPQAIVAASRQVELFDRAYDCEPAMEYGVHTLPPLGLQHRSPEAMVEAIEAAVTGILRGSPAPQVLAILGGEHSISPGTAKAMAATYGRKDLVAVQVDAHADLRAEYEGSPHSHACAARRILDVCPVFQIAIRNLSEGEARFRRTCKAVHTVFAEEAADPRGAFLKDLARFVRGKTVFFTIDLDGLDPSLMPAVGTPEPNGISWTRLLDVARAVTGSAKRMPVFDVVELAPIPGLRSPDFLAAKLVYAIFSLALMGRKRRLAGRQS